MTSEKACELQIEMRKKNWSLQKQPRYKTKFGLTNSELQLNDHGRTKRHITQTIPTVYKKYFFIQIHLFMTECNKFFGDKTGFQHDYNFKNNAISCLKTNHNKQALFMLMLLQNHVFFVTVFARNVFCSKLKNSAIAH